MFPGRQPHPHFFSKFDSVTKDGRMASKEDSSETVTGLADEIGMKKPFDLMEREVFLNLARTFSILNDQFQVIIKEFGLTGPQYNALRILRGHGEPVSVYQIGQQMISKQPDIPRLIDRLEKLELVSKRRCDRDRRVVWVTITQKGKSLLKRMDAPMDLQHREQFQHLEPRQLKQLNELLWLARQPKIDA